MACVTTDSSSVPTAAAPRAHLVGCVLIVGVGAVGGALAWQIARLGIRLRLIDKGVLGPTNVAWHEASTGDLGQPKAVVLADRIRERLPGSDVAGYADDFTRLDAAARDEHLAWADVVVAATDEARVQRFVNRKCLETAAPAVFPGVWIDPAGESEAGEIFWYDLRYGNMPCYECLTQRRKLPGDAQPGERGGDINVDALVRHTATVVKELLNPLDPAASFLQRERSFIRVRGNEPLRSRLANDFPKGQHVNHASVSLLPQPCQACGQSVPSPPRQTAPHPAQTFPRRHPAPTLQLQTVSLRTSTPPPRRRRRLSALANTPARPPATEPVRRSRPFMSSVGWMLTICASLLVAGITTLIIHVRADNARRAADFAAAGVALERAAIHATVDCYVGLDNGAGGPVNAHFPCTAIPLKQAATITGDSYWTVITVRGVPFFAAYQHGITLYCRQGEYDGANSWSGDWTQPGDLQVSFPGTAGDKDYPPKPVVCEIQTNGGYTVIRSTKIAMLLDPRHRFHP
jgi:molybdopterin/thiamine biosynthesis adenylyltransferase